MVTGNDTRVLCCLSALFHFLSFPDVCVWWGEVIRQVDKCHPFGDKEFRLSLYRGNIR